MPGFYVRVMSASEMRELQDEAQADRRGVQDEAAILIAEAIHARRTARGDTNVISMEAPATDLVAAAR